MPRSSKLAHAYIGISGYDYKGWRGNFYPEELVRRKWLSYASERFNSVELNGTFYSLKNPDVFRRWLADVPSSGFVFAIKGSRFITHNLKLRNTERALANFFASGILALGEATGPFLWQLPASYRFDPERIAAFIESLPRDARSAEKIADGHDERLRRGALTEATCNVPYRHAFEVRHESYFTDEFYALLEKYKCGFVIADTAGKFPYAEVVTANFVYIRLHGSETLYASEYSDEELDGWARRINRWRREGLDTYTYFDNDARGHAPFDAERLARRVKA
jgi:uncharacterized protein YecE (DUF72 family)